MRKLTLRLPTLLPSFIFIAALAVAGALAAGGCGSGGSQDNPPLPDVVIRAVAQFLDVGQRYQLDGSDSTDPNGDSSKLTYRWRLISGGPDTKFDDHCKDDFEQICFTNSDDPCSDDAESFCHDNADCGEFGVCQTNKGTTSPDCTTGICNIGLGAENAQATMLANVAGPFTVRLTAVGASSNGTGTMILDTYPSLYVVGSLFEFGGTQGGAVGEVADAAEFAAGAVKGAADPVNGNLVVIDAAIGALRVFDVHTGAILGSFGESDRFVTDPTALAFRADNSRLYVAQSDGDVLIFDAATGLLISTFGNVGANPTALAFAAESGDLLVVNGAAGSGVRVFGADGSGKGVLGETASEVAEPIDVDLLGDPATALLVADATGGVVKCGIDGNDCGPFGNVGDMLVDGSPSALAVNPSSADTDNEVLIADPVGKRVIACDASGENCETFGDTADLESDYNDVFFAPSAAPTTTTTLPEATTTTLP
ncbi:MAG: hypothetical protein HY899_13790 [Deltaproteobacteria bacterium]|nr:hypothetical protein [Deltaproteobacteria bacterium]